MRAWRKIVPLAAIAIGLAGCEHQYGLVAFFKDGRVAFKTDHTGKRCFDRVEVSEMGGPMIWAYWGAENKDDCPGKRPLIYGVAPPGSKQIMRPRALRSGHNYIVKAWAGDLYQANFQYLVERVASVRNFGEK